MNKNLNFSLTERNQSVTDTQAASSEDEILAKYIAGTIRVHDAAINMAELCASQSNTTLAEWLNRFLRIIDIDQQELSFLRALEEHARNETLTEDVWEEIKTRLDAFRNDLRIEAGNLQGLESSNTKPV